MLIRALTIGILALTLIAPGMAMAGDCGTRGTTTNVSFGGGGHGHRGGHHQKKGNGRRNRRGNKRGNRGQNHNRGQHGNQNRRGGHSHR